MKITKRPDPELLHVFAASLRVWLMDVCVWLAARLGVRMPRAVRIELRRELADALRDTRMLVFLLAVSRMRIPVVAAEAGAAWVDSARISPRCSVRR